MFFFLFNEKPSMKYFKFKGICWNKVGNKNADYNGLRTSSPNKIEKIVKGKMYFRREKFNCTRLEYPDKLAPS